MKAIKVFCIFIQIFLLLTINAIAVSVQDISVSPDSTNQYGKYTIDSRLTGSLAWVEANIDSIEEVVLNLTKEKIIEITQNCKKAIAKMRTSTITRLYFNILLNV